MTVSVPANAVVYRTTADDPRTSTLLAVAPNGRCLLLAGCNRAQRLLPVGRFQGTAPPALMSSLRQRLFGDAFRRSSSLDAVAPDEAHRSITIPGDGNAPAVKLAGRGIASPEFLAVEDIFTSLIGHLRRFPATVLLIEVSGCPKQVVSGGRTEIVLRLRNPGPVSVLVPSPDKWGTADGFVELSAMRVADAGQPREHGMEVQSFKSCDARSVSSFQPRSVRGLVPILPGESLEVHLNATLDWSVGPYAVDFTAVLSLYDGDRNHQMVVVAASPPFTLGIVEQRNEMDNSPIRHGRAT